MSPEQVTALIGAITALVVAVSAVLLQVRGLRNDINGRVAQLIDTTAAAAKKQGELEGRDFMQRLTTGAPVGDPPAPPGEAS